MLCKRLLVGSRWVSSLANGDETYKRNTRGLACAFEDGEIKLHSLLHKAFAIFDERTEALRVFLISR